MLCKSSHFGAFFSLTNSSTPSRSLSKNASSVPGGTGDCRGRATDVLTSAALYSGQPVQLRLGIVHRHPTTLPMRTGGRRMSRHLGISMEVVHAQNAAKLHEKQGAPLGRGRRLLQWIAPFFHHGPLVQSIDIGYGSLTNGLRICVDPNPLSHSILSGTGSGTPNTGILFQKCPLPRDSLS